MQLLSFGVMKPGREPFIQGSLSIQQKRQQAFSACPWESTGEQHWDWQCIKAQLQLKKKETEKKKNGSPTWLPKYKLNKENNKHPQVQGKSPGGPNPTQRTTGSKGILRVRGIVFLGDKHANWLTNTECGCVCWGGVYGIILEGRKRRRKQCNYIIILKR